MMTKFSFLVELSLLDAALIHLQKLSNSTVAKESKASNQIFINIYLSIVTIFSVYTITIQFKS